MKKKILFVDDEPNVLLGLKRMMRVHRAEFDIAFAESGIEAIEKLTQDRFDAVISDLRMPGMNGNELLEKISVNDPRIIRMILSGQSDHGSVTGSIGKTHQYFSKPCNPAKLVELIGKIGKILGTLNDSGFCQYAAMTAPMRCLPRTLSILESELEKNDPDIDIVNGAISSDILASSVFLQLVNTEYFGTYSHIKDIDEAVSIIGIDVIKKIIIDTGLFVPFSGESLDLIDFEEIQAHSNRSRDIAQRTPNSIFSDSKQKDNCVLAAFIHDIGKLLMIDYDPVKYRSLISGMNGDMSARADTERNIFGFTHQEAGDYFLKLRGFGDEITEAVASHHDPDKDSPVSRVTYYSNIIARTEKNSTGHLPDWILKEVTAAGLGKWAESLIESDGLDPVEELTL
ncbi:MAG: HDOD domain-containing protein [Candidatus Krumholzibacteriota bacterium]|nr:HDOD domain-containing protein [Candidatus Krumholzibacteriota bacterium]